MTPADGTCGGATSASAITEDLTGLTWRHWLACGSPREVLARIVHEDPLGVRDHVAQALRAGAWLLDADRVLLRTFALVARNALRYRGRPDVDAWIRSLADDAIAAALREDTEAERRGLAPATAPPPGRTAATSAGRTPDPDPGREHGAAFAALARPLGLEPRAMGRACLAFNRLPASERRAFHALVIAGRSLDEIAQETGESATDIARRARRALDAILSGAAAGSVPRPTAVVERKAGSTAESSGRGARSGQSADKESEVTS